MPKTAHGPSPRKPLGQHFLIDPTVLQRIVAVSELEPQDTVVEVGPGRGALTRHLVREAGRVIAIEIDPKLAASLPDGLDNPTNLTVINADAREMDLEQLLEGERTYKLVANLPYYAANPILRRFMEPDRTRPKLAVVMVQREVARRMVAEDGRMSLLAVSIQLYGSPSIVCYVPARAFYPPPKVTSAVVRIDPYTRPAIQAESVGEFFGVVKAGFASPRKQLRNSLSLGLGVSTDQASVLLALAELDPRQRAENLSLEDWWKLYRTCSERQSNGD